MTNVFRKDFPIVVSAYTPESHLGDYYKRAIPRLLRSLVRFDLHHFVLPLKNPERSWEEGVNMKLDVIIDALTSFHRSVLWIDADAEVLSFPEIFRNADFAFGAVVDGERLLGGTMYFDYSYRTGVFLNEWRKATFHPSMKGKIDEDAISLVRREWDALKFLDLPKAYNTTIQKGSDVSGLVIAHHIRPDVAKARGVEIYE